MIQFSAQDLKVDLSSTTMRISHELHSQKPQNITTLSQALHLSEVRAPTLLLGNFFVRGSVGCIALAGRVVSAGIGIFVVVRAICSRISLSCLPNRSFNQFGNVCTDRFTRVAVMVRVTTRLRTVVIIVALKLLASVNG